MTSISITKGYKVLVDTSMKSLIAAVSWCAKPHGKTVYALRRFGLGNNKQTTFYLHHVITGSPLNDLEVDHIDGNGLNNQRNNLRLVTHTENMRNRHLPNKTSQYLGIYFDKSRKQWAVRKGKKFIGRFKTEKEAYNALHFDGRKS